jgi:arylsulfatase A-like enzyme
VRIALHRLLAPLLAAALGCGADPPAAPEPLPNLLVVTIDTLRADHLSSYGYARETSPNLDALAAAGVRFELSFAAASTTLPSHVSLFTGTDPIAHGVVKNGLRVAPDTTLLAERLRDAGAQTAAIVSSFVLDRRFGLDRGFDHYEDDFTREGSSYQAETWRGFETKGAFDRRANLTTDRAIRWLDETRDPARPFFLFVHYFDPHDPYDPPEPWKSRFAKPPGAAPSLADALTKRDAIDAYDGEVAFADAEVGRLLAHLAKLGVERDTLVVVTSDHGEGLGQHGVLGHAVNIYEEAVRVPLLMRWPARLPAGKVVAEPVESVDVAPTLLDLMGVPPADGVRGRSLAGALLRGEPLDAEHAVRTHRRPYDEPIDEGGIRVHGELFGVRRGGWKWIEGSVDGTRELYDLSSDARESLNLASREPARAAEFAREVATFRAEQTRETPLDSNIDAEDKERLRALGYAE